MEHRDLIRVTDPNILNYYLNHSKIEPFNKPDGTGYLDSTQLLSLETTHCFWFSGGVLLFFLSEDNIYKGDVYCLPPKRGAFVIQKTKQALDYMFEFTDLIKAEIPSFNLPSRIFVRNLGFTKTGIIKDGWQKNGKLYDLHEYEIRSS